jgi:hypothetical protein
VALVPDRCSSLVEPSMSLNRNVTVPPDDGCDAVIPAGRRGSVVGGFGVLAQASGEAPQDRQRDLRLREKDRLEVPGRQGEAARRADGDDLGGARLPVQHGQLAEEIAGPDRCDRLAVPNDAGRPLTTMKNPVPISPWRAIT